MNIKILNFWVLKLNLLLKFKDIDQTPMKFLDVEPWLSEYLRNKPIEFIESVFSAIINYILFYSNSSLNYYLSLKG